MTDILSFALSNWLFLTLLALLPVAVLMYYIYRKDQNPEPFRTLTVTFCWGCFTVFPALAIEMLISSDSPFVETCMVVAPAEELCKFAVIWFYIWKHRDFNDSFDAIVYSVMASLGFAGIENLLYVLQNDWTIGVMRALLSVPGHAVFAVFMGYYFGRAKTHFYYGRRREMLINLGLSLMSAVAVHGVYDFLLTSENWFVFFLLYVAVMDVTAFKVVKKASINDRPMVMDF